MSVALLFPGQGSQSLNMMSSFDNNDVVRNIFEQAHKITGIDYFHMQKNDSIQINKTINTQPLLLVSSIAIFRVFQEKYNLPFSFIAGHSLGEWTSLVISGVLSFEDALQLVILRAKYMQEAVAEGIGAMAVVLGLDDNIVIDMCNKYSEDNSTIVSGVNFNAMGQVVIAGYKDAIEGITPLLKSIGAKRVQILPVSVPSHCSLMKNVALKLSNDMDKIKFQAPRVKIVQNLVANYFDNVNDIKSALIKQLYNPVLWHKSIDLMYNQGVNHFVECGPNKVLTGLNKRINANIISISISNFDDIISFEGI